jgi:hypothetical protein
LTHRRILQVILYRALLVSYFTVCVASCTCCFVSGTQAWYLMFAMSFLVRVVLHISHYRSWYSFCHISCLSCHILYWSFYILYLPYLILYLLGQVLRLSCCTISSTPYYMLFLYSHAIHSVSCVVSCTHRIVCHTHFLWCTRPYCSW